MNEEKLIDGLYLTRDAVVEQYAGLVNQHANRLARDDYHLREDLKQEGYIGLLKAYDRYDIDAGNKFMTYAVQYVRGYMLRQHDKRGVIHTPVNIIRAAWRIERADMWELENEEISEQLGILKSEARSARIYFDSRNVASFDKSNNTESDNGVDSLHNSLGYTEDYSMLAVDEYMELLTGREIKLLRLLVMGYKQAEASRLMGFSKTWAGMELRSVRSKLEHLEVANQ